MPVGEPENLLGIDIADHHQHRVVRCIPAPIELARVVDGQVLEVVHPADDRRAVRMRAERGGIELLEQRGTRPVVGAPAALLHHDLHLAREYLGLHRQVRHALGLELKHGAEVLRGQLLVVGSVVTPGEGIVAAADLGDAARELAVGQAPRATEHHVFGDMREAGQAVHLVDAADPVPDHGHHHRRTTVLAHDDLQAVVQHPFDGAAVRRARGKQGRAEQQDCHRQPAGQEGTRPQRDGNS